MQVAQILQATFATSVCVTLALWLRAVQLVRCLRAGFKWFPACIATIAFFIVNLQSEQEGRLNFWRDTWSVNFHAKTCRLVGSGPLLN